jgi:NADH-quinone oxidoreductase subunit E
MVKERIERALSEMPVRASSKAERAGQVLPSLQQVQREFGYIPKEAVPAVAAFAGVPESHVYGVATFYAHFKFTPPGKHHITVCCGTACHVRGSSKLVGDLQDRLKIHAGETTPDGNFSLETTACFGSCALAPVIVVGGKVQGRMNRSRILKTIDVLDKS